MKIIKQHNRKRLSFITDVILFILLILIFIGIINNTDIIDFLKFNTLNSNNYYSYKDENELYIKKLKDEYGVNILYGKNTDRIISSMNAEKQCDENIVNDNLKKIYNALSKYPAEVFIPFKSKKYPLYVILVDKFNDDNIAIASKNKLNEVKIYISNDKKFERAFHHELFHILEYYMSDKNEYAYSNWQELNPKGFNYNVDISSLTKEYVYSSNNSTYVSSNDAYYTEINHLLNTNSESDGQNRDNNYFVTKYAKVSEKEDRAETFCELMTMVKLPDFFYKGTNIRKKAEYILQGISQNITTEPLYCTKILEYSD